MATFPATFGIDFTTRAEEVYASPLELLQFMRMETVTLSPEDQELMDVILAAASRSVDADTLRVFYQTDETRLVDGSGLKRLRVDLVSVEEIKLDDVALTQGAEEDYVLRGPATAKAGWPYVAVQYVASGEVWPVGIENVSIEGVWGWPSVPHIVHLAAMNRAALVWKGRDREASVRELVDAEFQWKKFAPTTMEKYGQMAVRAYRRPHGAVA